MDKEVKECEFLTYTVDKERVCDLLEDWCECILCEKCDTRKLYYQEVANGILESELNKKEKQLHQSQQENERLKHDKLRLASTLSENIDEYLEDNPTLKVYHELMTLEEYAKSQRTIDYCAGAFYAEKTKGIQSQQDAERYRQEANNNSALAQKNLDKYFEAKQDLKVAVEALEKIKVCDDVKLGVLRKLATQALAKLRRE